MLLKIKYYMFSKGHKFFVLKKRWVAVILLALLIVFGCAICTSAIKTSIQPKPTRCIVIDAGHGGIDGGAIGETTDVTEAYLNLQFALKLKKLCEEYGFKVVLTRKDMKGLYSLFAKNKKKSEMQKRKEIIEKSAADLVVSIHMNSFGLSTARGAQVYYAPESESGKKLATSVQVALHDEVEYAKLTPKEEEFYLLLCSSAPSILVECGFLSNPEEEQLLSSQDYQTKFCYALLYGILKYFAIN